MARKYLIEAVMVRAARLVRRIYLMAIIYSCSRANMDDSVTTSREMIKAPQQAIRSSTNLPGGVQGDKSP